MTNKAPEQMAEEYANESGWLEGDYVWREANAGFLAGYRAAENHFRDATEKVGPQWISVKERLPEYDQLALLWQSEMKAQFVGRRRDSGLEFPLYYWECTEDFFEAWKEIYFPKLMHEGVVTHWMPLPEPPKEEK